VSTAIPTQPSSELEVSRHIWHSLNLRP